MTTDERIEAAVGYVDSIVALQFAEFETAIEAEFDADDRAVLIGAWRAAWAAERHELLDRLRTCAELALGTETIH